MDKATDVASSSLFSADIFGNEDNVSLQEKPAEEPKPAPILTKVEQEIYDALTPQEAKEIEAVIRNMDLTKSGFISEYGKEARDGMADVNEKALAVTRTKDLGESGRIMSNLILQLKGIKVPSQERGIFRKARSYVAQLNAELKPAEENVSKAVAIMQKHQEQLVKDIDSFDRLYKSNLGYYRALTMYIIAGKLKLDQERKTTLEKLRQKASETGDMADAENFNAYSAKLNQFDSLLNEFESSKVLCQQTAAAIRMAKENNQLLIQKFDFIFTTAVPSWRNQIQLALNLENSRQAAAAANSAIDFTNALIRQNADTLKQGTIETAKLSEREIIESDTLEYAQARLIESIESVFQIRADGQAKREESRQKKAMLEEDLKNELLQLTARRQS